MNPAEIATRKTNAPKAAKPISHSSTVVIHRRSTPCSAAANATSPKQPKPAASPQVMTSVPVPPTRAAISAPSPPPARRATITDATSRPVSTLRRSTLPSMIQKPSAAEATTGPNMRAATRASARKPATAAQGSRPRAARQDSDEQLETLRWACRMELISMAPITTKANTAT